RPPGQAVERGTDARTEPWQQRRHAPAPVAGRQPGEIGELLVELLEQDPAPGLRDSQGPAEWLADQVRHAPPDELRCRLAYAVEPREERTLPSPRRDLLAHRVDGHRSGAGEERQPHEHDVAVGPDVHLGV